MSASPAKASVFKRINHEDVTAVPQLMKPDIRPIKGSILFGELYANIFLCARKKSGKTSAIFKIIKECVGKNTTILAFVSTLNKDSNWLTIQKYCEVKKIPFIGQTSIMDSGVNLLDEFVQQQQRKDTEPIDEKKKETKKPHLLFNDSESDSDSESDAYAGKAESKQKKSKFRAPEYLIIFDDLSHELKNPALVSLLKKNRHLKSKIIVSSQYLNDLDPQSRKQCDYYLVFKGQPLKKLDEIYRDADIAVTPDQFYEIYHSATESDYSFLYIDRFNDKFRRNFSHELI